MQKPRPFTNWDDVPIIFDIPIACQILGNTYDHIQKMCKKGLIPSRHVGKEWRFEKDEFREWFKNLGSAKAS